MRNKRIFGNDIYSGYEKYLYILLFLFFLLDSTFYSHSIELLSFSLNDTKYVTVGFS